MEVAVGDHPTVVDSDSDDEDDDNEDERMYEERREVVDEGELDDFNSFLDSQPADGLNTLEIPQSVLNSLPPPKPPKPVRLGSTESASASSPTTDPLSTPNSPNQPAGRFTRRAAPRKSFIDSITSSVLLNPSGLLSGLLSASNSTKSVSEGNSPSFNRSKTMFDSPLNRGPVSPLPVVQEKERLPSAEGDEPGRGRRARRTNIIQHNNPIFEELSQKFKDHNTATGEEAETNH
jgi:hypothetical protein